MSSVVKTVAAGIRTKTSLYRGEVAEPDLGEKRQHDEYRAALANPSLPEQVEKLVAVCDKFAVRESLLVSIMSRPEKRQPVWVSSCVDSLEDLLRPVEPLRDIDLRPRQVFVAPFARLSIASARSIVLRTTRCLYFRLREGTGNRIVCSWECGFEWIVYSL